MEKKMAPLSDGNATDKINWEWALKTHLTKMNYLVLRCSKLNPSAPAYGLKEKLKKVIMDAISELYKKHNVSLLVNTQSMTGESDMEMSTNTVNIDNIWFIDLPMKTTNAKSARDENKQEITLV